MRRFLLLLCIFPTFAQESSGPFMEIGVGVSNSPYHAPIAYRSERLNFPLEASLGYEFYLFKNIHPSLAVTLARGGWDWKLDGYGGYIRYIYPAIDVNIIWHSDKENLTNDLFGINFLNRISDLFGIGFFMGWPKVTEKLDAIYAAGDAKHNCTIYGNSLFMGYKIFDNYRIIFKYQISLLEYKGYDFFIEESLRLNFQYIF